MLQRQRQQQLLPCPLHPLALRLMTSLPSLLPTCSCPPTPLPAACGTDLSQHTHQQNAPYPAAAAATSRGVGVHDLLGRQYRCSPQFPAGRGSPRHHHQLGPVVLRQHSQSHPQLLAVVTRSSAVAQWCEKRWARVAASVLPCPGTHTPACHWQATLRLPHRRCRCHCRCHYHKGSNNSATAYLLWHCTSRAACRRARAHNLLVGHCPYGCAACLHTPLGSCGGGHGWD